jgi:RNA polymerase sigma factor (TIGR02999 family)
MMGCMDDVSRITTAIDNGDAQAASQLLPLVYDDLRRLAAQRMAEETPGQTLSATALVHEAYVRLIAPDVGAQWKHRGHFYFAAAEAMRRILIERARSKQSQKRGGQKKRLQMDELTLGIDSPGDDILALSQALTEFEAQYPQAAQLVKLRFFGGLGHLEAAEAMEVGRRTADRLWVIARTWLYNRLSDDH